MTEYMTLGMPANENFIDDFGFALDDYAARGWIFDQMIALPTHEICIVLHRDEQPTDNEPMENNCDHDVQNGMCIKCGYRWDI